MNLLEEDIGGKLQDIGFGNDFLDMTPKAKIDKLDYTKFKKLLCKGNYQCGEKATYRIGENIVNHVSGKRLIFRMYKELPQFNNKKMNNN